MHYPTDRIAHTTAFGTPVVEHWLEREIAQWVTMSLPGTYGIEGGSKVSFSPNSPKLCIRLIRSFTLSGSYGIGGGSIVSVFLQIALRFASD